MGVARAGFIRKVSPAAGPSAGYPFNPEGGNNVASFAYGGQPLHTRSFLDAPGRFLRHLLAD